MSPDRADLSLAISVSAPVPISAIVRTTTLIVRILLPSEKAFDGSASKSRFNCCSASVKVVLVVQVRGASVD